jgi:uncharacterized membrane protein
MVLCPQCGAPLAEQARFCTRCGAVASHTPAVDEYETIIPPAATEGPGPECSAAVGSRDDASDEALPIPENIAAVVVYMTIIPAVAFLFVEPFKRNMFVRFHAFQHLFLWAAAFAFGIVASIVGMLLQLIPFMRVLVFPLLGLVSLAWFFLWLLLVVKAYHHELFKLPIIGDLAEQRMHR